MNLIKNPLFKGYLFVSIGAILIISILDFIYKPDPGDILVEAHGLLFDLIVFGLVITIFESRKNKQDIIEKYKDNLRRCIGWHSEEAKQLLKEAVEKLNSLNITKDFHIPDCNMDDINLPNAKLNSSHISDVSAKRSFFPSAEFKNSSIFNSNFYNSALTGVNFENALLCGSDFSSCPLEDANFTSANLRGVNFMNSDLTGAIFTNSNMEYVNLKGAKVLELNWIESLKKSNIKGIEFVENNFKVNPIAYTKEWDEYDEEFEIKIKADELENYVQEEYSVYYKIEKIPNGLPF